MFRNYYPALLGILFLTGPALYADKVSSKAKAMPTSATEQVHVSLTGDFIYWQPREDGLSIGRSLGTSTSAGHTEFINFTYAPGFKIGMQIDCAHDAWDTQLMYTWFDSSTDTASLQQTAFTGTLDSNLISSISSGSLTSINGSWNLYFNAVDWELGHHFSVGKFLKLRPHMGIKGAWNHQNLEATVNSLDFLTENPLSTSTYQHQSFWGTGIRIGLNTAWFFAKNFNIYGNLAFAELYGQFLDRVRSVTHDLTTGSQDTDLLQNQSIHQLEPVFELSLGLGYKVHFGKRDGTCFFIQAGWEQQIWWEQNRFIVVNSPGYGGNLTFQGLDLKIGFTF